MELKVQKRLAADVLKCSPKRVWFSEQNLEEIKESITKADMRVLANRGVIQEKPARNNSRGRIRQRLAQKRKGRQKGHGSRKGKKTARSPKKDDWMKKIRLQRTFIKELKDKQLIDAKIYRQLYLKCKGGYFRSKRHIKLYLEEHALFVKK